MHYLTLEWTSSGQTFQRVLPVATAQKLSKASQRFLLGRDPGQCDVVLEHPTVSGLHVEISFETDQFVLRNLKPTNPPWVDGVAIATSTPLHLGSQIYLGQQAITVTAVVIVPFKRISQPVGAGQAFALGQSLAATVMPPDLFAADAGAGIAAGQVAMGLRCPHCRRVLPYEHLENGCHWCGTSLAAADSVLLDA